MKIKLFPKEIRRFDRLVAKEVQIKKECQERLLAVAKEASEMMDELSERKGVDMRAYQIDWEAGVAVPKPKREKPDGEAQTTEAG
jgi:peptide deformylase